MKIPSKHFVSGDISKEGKLEIVVAHVDYVEEKDLPGLIASMSAHDSMQTVSGPLKRDAIEKYRAEGKGLVFTEMPMMIDLEILSHYGLEPGDNISPSLQGELVSIQNCVDDTGLAAKEVLDGMVESVIKVYLSDDAGGTKTLVTLGSQAQKKLKAALQTTDETFQQAQAVQDQLNQKKLH